MFKNNLENTMYPPLPRCERHEEAACPPRVFFELYPEFPGQFSDAATPWFEIALHAEMEEYHSPDHPRSRAALTALMDVADQLILQARSVSYDTFDLSPSHYTLHPSEQNDAAGPKLARTVRLVFSSSAPVERSEEDAVTGWIKARLELLNVPRLQMDPAVR